MTIRIRLIKSGKIINIEGGRPGSLEEFMHKVQMKLKSLPDMENVGIDRIKITLPHESLGRENFESFMRQIDDYAFLNLIVTDKPEQKLPKAPMIKEQEAIEARKKMISERLLLPRFHEERFGSVYVRRMLSAELQSCKAVGDYTDSFKKFPAFLDIATLLKNDGSLIDIATIDKVLDLSFALLQKSFEGSTFSEEQIARIISGFRVDRYEDPLLDPDQEGYLTLRGFLRKWMTKNNKGVKEMVAGLLNYVDSLLKEDHQSRANSLGQFPNSLYAEGTYRACFQGAQEKLDKALTGFMQNGSGKAIIPGRKMMVRQKLLLKKAVEEVETRAIVNLGTYGMDVHARPSLSRVLGVNDGEGEYLLHYYERVGKNTDEKWEMYSKWTQKLNKALDKIATDDLQIVLNFIKTINIYNGQKQCFYDDKRNIYYKVGRDVCETNIEGRGDVVCKKFAEREYVSYVSEGVEKLMLIVRGEGGSYFAYDNPAIKFTCNSKDYSCRSNDGTITGKKIIKAAGYYNVADNNELITSLVLDARGALQEKLQELSVIGFDEEIPQETFYSFTEEGRQWAPEQDLVFQLKRYLSPTFLIQDEEMPGDEESILTSITSLNYRKHGNHDRVYDGRVLNDEIQIKLINALRSFRGEVITLETIEGEAIQAEHSAALNLLFQCYGGLCSVESRMNHAAARQRDQYIGFMIKLGIGLLEPDYLLSYIVGRDDQIFFRAAEAACLLLTSLMVDAGNDIHVFMQGLLLKDFEWIEQECKKAATLARLGFVAHGKRLQFLIKQAEKTDDYMLFNSLARNPAINSEINRYIQSLIFDFSEDLAVGPSKILLHSYKMRYEINEDMFTMGPGFVDALVRKKCYKALLFLWKNNICKDYFCRKMAEDADLKENILIYFAEKGDVAATMNLLDAVTIDEDCKIRALVVAARNNRKTMVKMLLDKDVVASADYFSNLLLEAKAKPHYMEIINILMNHPSADIHSYFFAALINGRDDIAYDLLDKKDGVDALDSNGRNFLHYAVQAGNLAMVKNLINIHLLEDVADRHGMTPLMIAVRGNFDEIILELLKKEADFYSCFAALQFELSNENIFKLLQLIKESGVAVDIAKLMPIFSAKPIIQNKINDLFLSADQIENLFKTKNIDLITEALWSKPQIVKENAAKFLNHYVSFIDKDNIVALIIILAAFETKAEKAEILNSSYGKNEPIIFTSVKKGYIEITNFLISEGANVAICNSKGNNLIMEVVLNKREDMFLYLAQLPEIDFTVINAEGDSILNLISNAKKTGVATGSYDRLFSLAIGRGADVVKFAKDCFEECREKKCYFSDDLEILLTLMDPNDPRLYSILKMALEYDNMQYILYITNVIRKIPSHKFNFNPIHVATQSRSPGGVDSLCRLTNVDSKDEYGETALEKLITQYLEKDGSHNDYVLVAQALISNGAKVDSKIRGKSLLYHIANLAVIRPDIIGVNQIFSDILKRMGGLIAALPALEEDIVNSQDNAVMQYILKSLLFVTAQGNLLHILTKVKNESSDDVAINKMFVLLLKSSDEETKAEAIFSALNSGEYGAFFTLCEKIVLTMNVKIGIFYRILKERDGEKQRIIWDKMYEAMSYPSYIEEGNILTAVFHKAIVARDQELVRFLCDRFSGKIKYIHEEIIESITNTTKHRSEKDLIAIIEYLKEKKILSVAEIVTRDYQNLLDFALNTAQEDLAAYCQSFGLIPFAVREFHVAVTEKNLEKVEDLCSNKRDHIILANQSDIISSITHPGYVRNPNLINIVRILSEHEIIDLNAKNNENESLYQFANRLNLSELKEFLQAKGIMPEPEPVAASSFIPIVTDRGFIDGVRSLAKCIKLVEAKNESIVKIACNVLEYFDKSGDSQSLSGKVADELRAIIPHGTILEGKPDVIRKNFYNTHGAILVVIHSAKRQGLSSETLGKNLNHILTLEARPSQDVGSPKLGAVPTMSALAK